MYEKSICIPVMAYCESALNAMSHTQRWFSDWRVEWSEKSEVFHNLAVWSAEVVARYLYTKQN